MQGFGANRLARNAGGSRRASHVSADIVNWVSANVVDTGQAALAAGNGSFLQGTSVAEKRSTAGVGFGWPRRPMPIQQR